MIIYVHTISPRFRYITDFIGKEISSENFFTLISDVDDYRRSKDFKINYSPGPVAENEWRLTPHTLLAEKDIRKQKIDCFEWNGCKAFFKTGGDFPFDIFAASFYLLSRYEEYLPHDKDMYGRYAHENSLAFREDFLRLPLVNIWISQFKQILEKRFPELFARDSASATHEPPIPFFPTYDIDEAWSYRHKPFWKNAGGVIRSLFKGEWRLLRERVNVLSRKKEDPYEAYPWMDQLHQRFNLKPIYFFIVAGKTGKYDKNILPGKKAMGELIKRQGCNYPLGIHPSWQSGDDPSLIKKEKEALEKISGVKIASSRQHYIRFTLPQTFRRLMDAGIKVDFSMGYGSINGFRASVASSFFWYDLEMNVATTLLLRPFCYMDANSFYEQKHTALQAFEEMKMYYETVRQAGGTMISIWHNNFLGTGGIYTGWREAYEKFITGIQA